MRQALTILGTLTDADIDWLATAGNRRAVVAGQDIVQEGRPLDSLYLTLDGRFAVRVIDPASPNGVRTVRELAAGEVVGEISLLDSRPPSASVTATTDGHVLEIGRKDLDRQLTNNPAFAARFYKALAVFLAQRLRSNTILSNAGPSPSVQATENADEIDPEVLEQIALAAARFQWIVNRLSQN